MLKEFSWKVSKSNEVENMNYGRDYHQWSWNLNKEFGFCKLQAFNRIGMEFFGGIKWRGLWGGSNENKSMDTQSNLLGLKSKHS